MISSLDSSSGFNLGGARCFNSHSFMASDNVSSPIRTACEIWKKGFSAQFSFSLIDLLARDPVKCGWAPNRHTTPYWVTASRGVQTCPLDLSIDVASPQALEHFQLCRPQTATITTTYHSHYLAFRLQRLSAADM
jgi:hypothetical protein